MSSNDLNQYSEEFWEKAVLKKFQEYIDSPAFEQTIEEIKAAAKGQYIDWETRLSKEMSKLILEVIDGRDLPPEEKAKLVRGSMKAWNNVKKQFPENVLPSTDEDEDESED